MPPRRHEELTPVASKEVAKNWGGLAPRLRIASFFEVSGGFRPYRPNPPYPVLTPFPQCEKGFR
ncbi:protein of unknown function [Methylocaldum szegediense]|uniref:Uncharacterized protein n=1 Tax=Methylocaldum szegediense TaxID=73780 RepID=A0ABM9HYE1_9GAMM|nr:protein of unknown function [Methylocaldum szegediense]